MTILSRPPRFRAAFALAAFAVVATASPVDAQFTGGLKGGVGQSSYTGDHEFKWQLSGPNTTAFFNWGHAGRLSQQLEIGTTRRLGISDAGGSELTLDGTYVDMLLLEKFTFGKNLGTRPFVSVGPMLTYVASCNLKFVTTGLPTSNTACDELSSSRISFGVAAAGGLSWQVGRSTLSVEARGSASLKAVPLEAQNSRPFAWTVLAGVAVPIHFNFGRRAPGVPAGVASAQTAMPLEPLGAGVITESHPAAAPELSGLTGAGASTKKISVTAIDADARSLLIAIAREAGISLVVSNDVRRRVSVSFKDIAPEDAIRAIIADAGLTVMDPPSARSLPSVVFYQLPLNVNEAPAEAISARFGVSAEIANWLAENRPVPAAPRQKQP